MTIDSSSKSGVIYKQTDRETDRQNQNQKSRKYRHITYCKHKQNWPSQIEQTNEGRNRVDA